MSLDNTVSHPRNTTSALLTAATTHCHFWGPVHRHPLVVSQPPGHQEAEPKAGTEECRGPELLWQQLYCGPAPVWTTVYILTLDERILKNLE